MTKLFGTDGIRGVANTDPMIPEMMVKIGMALGEILLHHSGGVVIGHDSRLSGQMLECALTSGILATGIDVLAAGMIPTPAVAFLTKTLSARAGIVISASHNPAKDNGIKIFSSDGFKLPDALELRIEEAVLGEYSPKNRPIGAGIGRIQQLGNAGEQYVEHVLQSVFAGNIPNFRTMKIVVDCANGAASLVAPIALERLGVSVDKISDQPDGLNLNLECGAVDTNNLQQRVIQKQADIGIAFDGDADRIILVDEHGDEVDGDHIMAMLARDLLRKGQLKNNILVTTVMSNLGLELAMKAANIQVVRTAVGDRHVVQKMREIDANLGGEQAGHIIMLDHATTGDGLMAALTILKILQASGKPLSELAACFKRFPQTLINIPVKSRKPIEDMVGVSQAIDRAKQELGKRGRVLVRYSGTELLARVMVEAEDENIVKRIAESVAEEIRKENM